MMQDSATFFYAGIDIGSTTVKVAIINEEGELVFSRYCRHQGKTMETTRSIFQKAFRELGDVELDLALTGSAGMGVAEAFKVPFVQEVVASAHYIGRYFPTVKTFIEIGGEDSKIIFFDDNGRPNIRMNSNCAGGTGAFIDQMAVLLNVDVSDLNGLAEKSTQLFPIASRCGVFAKTDIQALLSRHVPHEDIAASIFHAVAMQVASLSSGRDMERKILVGGGPLTFIPQLRKAFIDLLELEHPDDLVLPERSELIPAMGVAMIRNGKHYRAHISNLLSQSEKKFTGSSEGQTIRLPPLFAGKTELELWQKRHEQAKIPRVDLLYIGEEELFLGIDSGSTTTKIVLVDAQGRLAFGHYGANNGDPIMAVKKGLSELREIFARTSRLPRIARSAATGYGENLIRAAFGLHDGVVETMAHCRAAQKFDPDVSFILDIGGQDMKAISIVDHVVVDIHINEACSSGCGSFIETLANSLGYRVQEFAEIACEQNAPFDLGTRCTVFMNSKIKQALREGASVSEISAGLAYSVVKNALFKVLKLKDTNQLGDKIVVQGGTFRNPAVLRAVELLLNREVIRPDISELMGAYGAALTAVSKHLTTRGASIPMTVLDNLEAQAAFIKRELRCSGCENSCSVLEVTFGNKNRFFTGNRCERYFSNNPDAKHKGKNLLDEQLKLLFDRTMEPTGEPRLTYGIPRCLNMYENFPFWSAFLTTCGFRVVLSDPSNQRLYAKGTSTVMSENVCFPAKLSHGHLFDLVDKKIDRIFYPTVVYEKIEFKDALNSFNCPVVTGYPDLIKSAINPEKKFGIPLDNPAISFKDAGLLRDQLYLYFMSFGLKYKTVSMGVKNGLAAQRVYREQLGACAKTLLAGAEKAGRTVVVLAGRPYHLDPLINHGIPDLLTDLGVDVVSEHAVLAANECTSLAAVNVLTQWSYANRLYAVAAWVNRSRNTRMVQLTSFGCGPDAVSADEMKEILRSSGNIHTAIKMDDINNLGAVRIRLRSMLEATQRNNSNLRSRGGNRKNKDHLGTANNRKKTLITPFFSSFYSPLVPAAFKPLGLHVEVLPPQDRQTVELGLKTINNDMCYPAILVAGDIIKAFQSGGYDPESTAVILTQTGGQCRASSYLSLVRKALADFGLDNVQVIPLFADGIDPGAGFTVNSNGLVKQLALGVIFADPLTQMFLSSMAREKTPGTAKKLHGKYLSAMETGIENGDYQYLLNLLREAVADFNLIETHDKPVPRIGVVGEIFVKYNFFSNGDIIDWLSGQGIEVILPALQSFFAQRFINETYDQKAFFKRSFADRMKNLLLEIYTEFRLGQIDRVMQEFRFYRMPHNLRELSQITGDVVSLANQFGEGWLLTAEMIAMLKEGIGEIVCLQPFGCISNHITGRGMEKKLKNMYPHLNLLSLDMDAGASEVNILNRLHFLVSDARERVSSEKEPMADTKEFRRFAVPSMLSPNLDDLNSYAALEIEKWRAWVSGLGLWGKTQSIKRKIGW